MQRPIVRIVLLVLLATVLAFVATRVLSMRSDEEVTNEVGGLDQLETEFVAVAMRNLAIGTPLGVDDLRLQSWPTALLPEGTVREPEELVGRVLRVSVASGIPLLMGALLPRGASTEMDWQIESGHRAMSIATSSSGGLAGFVFPGSRVDVLVTFEAPESVKNADLMVATLVQDLRVLATDQEMTRDPEAERKIVDLVTLEVSPDEAERLLLGLSEGDLHLVMRFGGEERLSSSSTSSTASTCSTVSKIAECAAGVTAADLVPERYQEKKRARKPVTRRKRRPVVSVIRGLNTTSERL